MPSAPTENYTYDAIYQLTQVVQNGSTTSESYTYDPVGNRLSSMAASPWNYNVSNQLTSISGSPGTTFTYDNNGNTTSKTDTTGTTTYAWDYENRLASVTLPNSGGTVSFTYDPLGRRIRKVFSSATTIYAYDGENIVEETDASGNAVARYAMGLLIDEPLAMLRSAATHYYSADGLGSVTSLTDGSGAVAASYTYDAFGNLAASTGSLTNPFRYTAREWDSETGLYFYRARYYDQAAGRFLSEDPSGFFGSDLKLYAYVGSSPTSFADPIGLDRTPRKGAPNSTQRFPNPKNPNAGTVRVYGPEGEAQTDYDYGHDHAGAGDPHAHDWGRDAKDKPVRGRPRPVRPGEKVPPIVCESEAPKEGPRWPIPEEYYCTQPNQTDCIPREKPWWKLPQFFPWIPTTVPGTVPSTVPIRIPLRPLPFPI